VRRKGRRRVHSFVFIYVLRCLTSVLSIPQGSCYPDTLFSPPPPFFAPRISITIAELDTSAGTGVVAADD
jgi:hypothetical protein